MRKFPLLAALSVVLFTVAPSLGQTNPLHCVAVDDDTERLACYDAIFAADETVGDGILIESEQQIPAFPSGRGNASLVLSCEAEQLQLQFRFAGNIISATGSQTGITLQRDLLRAQAITLPPSPDGTALVLSGTTQVDTLIQSLQGVTNLGVRVTPASSRSLNVRFRVADLLERAAPVITACR